MDVATRKALDKFYTKPEAVNAFMAFINRHVDITSHQVIVEPSAGDGAILGALPSRAVGVDLYPEHPAIIRHDFLTWEGYAPGAGALTIGNPPFGKRSSLAVQFFNKAAKHSSVIAFIVPVTWEQYSIHRQLAPGWALVATERLPEESFTLGDKPLQVRCSMQVWERSDAPGLRHLTRPTGDNPFFDFVKKGEGEFAIRQAYPKTVGPEDIDGQSYFHIKPKVPGVRAVFESIQWQTPVNRARLGGASVPCLDKATVVKFYERAAGWGPA